MLSIKCYKVINVINYKVLRCSKMNDLKMSPENMLGIIMLSLIQSSENIETLRPCSASRNF